MKKHAPNWDIFCAVVDNFGDIGICWRLCRQLAAEHQIAIRLWVDDLASFKKICPEVDVKADSQIINAVQVCFWHSNIAWHDVEPANVVIEALACTIPFAYQQQMARYKAQQMNEPLWINLEYLSAEEWVEGCHALASPQPALPLTKYFFFPGFTDNTGGLLQEANLQNQADQFITDRSAQARFWQSLNITDIDYTLKISLFAYEHAELSSLLSMWLHGEQAVLCLVPEGLLAKQLVKQIPALSKNGMVKQGQLTIKILPFLPQQQYDQLLWACDINFVRGEDSIIRAHWATHPFIWQIYRQQDQAHITKLKAFLTRYTRQMPADMADAVTLFYLQWNTDQPLQHSWQGFSAYLADIQQFNVDWRQQLSANGDLASNLVHFVEKKTIMPRNFS